MRRYCMFVMPLTLDALCKDRPAFWDPQ